MARYLVLWEVDLSRTPEDPGEKKAQWELFQGVVKGQISDGLITEWGQCAGEPRGYAIVEGNEVQLTALTNLYTPFIKFTSRPVMSLEQTMEATDAIQG